MLQSFDTFVMDFYSTFYNYTLYAFLFLKGFVLDLSLYISYYARLLLSKIPKNVVPLPQRMDFYLDKYNSFKSHSYKGHVVVIKSKRILDLFKSSKNSLEKLDMIHSSMINICHGLMEKYNPRLIYTFSDEVHLVFMYNDNTSYIFNGNVHKLLTNVSSTMAFLISKFGLISVNPEITAKFVQFSNDYELLNFIAWKQSHCFSKSQEMAPYLNVDNVPFWFKYGTFLKKKIFVKFDSKVERDVDYDYTSVYPDDVVFRKQVVTFQKHLFSEFTDFDQCFQLLIVNNYLVDKSV